MTRVYRRKFDWDDARTRYQAGAQISAIAQIHKVSEAAIRRVVIPGEYERMLKHSLRWQEDHKGTCVDCGAEVVVQTVRYGSGRCRKCSGAAQATSVRPDTLWCFACQSWLPDEEFPGGGGGGARRGRHRQCRSCNTIQKRLWRQRNPEHERAYQRVYKRKRRAEGKE